MNTEEQTVVTYVLAQGSAARAIEFYQKIFGAEESSARFTDPAGKIGHAEITIGNTRIMLADEAPPEHRFAPVLFYVRVGNADAVVDKALAAGARLERAIANQSYGDRSGIIVDPFGHRWMVSQTIEDVSKEELQKRVGGEYSIS